MSIKTLLWFNQPLFLKKPIRKIFVFYFFFETVVGESSPQNVSTGTLNLVLIVRVLLAIFILAIAVLFGILFC